MVEAWWEPVASDDERSLAASLRECDLQQLTASLPDLDDPSWSLAVDIAGLEVRDTDPEPPLLSDDDLVAALTGPAHPSDVSLLASSIPRRSPTPRRTSPTSQRSRAARRCWLR